jgi:hypothetical protein
MTMRPWSDDDRPPIGDPEAATLDRLVEGTLASDERRAVLLRLEADPDGWRRCALAFLEAQAWREALGGLADEMRAPAPSDLVPVRRIARPRLRVLARAAALLVAFGLGWMLARGGAPSTERPPGPGNGALIVQAAPPVAPAPPSTTEPTAPEPPDAPPILAEAAPDPPAADRAVRFVPVGFRPALRTAAPAPRNAPDAVPPDLRGRLARRGYRVEQRPGLATLDLEDGRRVDVPVEEVRLQYVGSRTY